MYLYCVEIKKEQVPVLRKRILVSGLFPTSGKRPKSSIPPCASGVVSGVLGGRPIGLIHFNYWNMDRITWHRKHGSEIKINSLD